MCLHHANGAWALGLSSVSGGDACIGAWDRPGGCAAVVSVFAGGVLCESVVRCVSVAARVVS